MALLNLACEIHACGADQMTAGGGVLLVGERCVAGFDRDIHKSMPRWVVLHLVDAVTGAVVSMEHRFVDVCLDPQLVVLRRARGLSKSDEMFVVDVCNVVFNDACQQRVGLVEVVVDKVWRLIGDLMCRWHGRLPSVPRCARSYVTYITHCCIAIPTA